MTDDERITKILQHQGDAQKAAEERLEDMYLRFSKDMDGDESAWDGYQGESAYCGCDTCLVREILTAAWDHLMRAAALELT
jgi:hypothetical protein